MLFGMIKNSAYLIGSMRKTQLPQVLNNPSFKGRVEIFNLKHAFAA